LQHISFGIGLYFSKVQIFELAGEVERTAEIFQLFFCEGGDFFEINILVNRTAGVERQFFLIEALKAAEPGKNGLFDVSHLPVGG
jgi:hypothetical protein